jgi:hypothetical protein
MEIEGENALLLASLAQVHAAYIEGGFRVDEETQNAAERCAQRAVALDPAMAPAHSALGVLAYAHMSTCSGPYRWEQTTPTICFGLCMQPVR